MKGILVPICACPQLSDRYCDTELSWQLFKNAQMTVPELDSRVLSS